MFRVYLAGPIQDCTNEQCNDWRQYVIAKFTNSNLALRFSLLNPMDRDYREKYQDPLIAAEIIELDKRDINSSDVILANITKYSTGTSMELLYGWERDKIIVSIVPKNEVISPWIIYHSTKLVYSLDEGIEWIDKFVR